MFELAAAAALVKSIIKQAYHNKVTAWNLHKANNHGIKMNNNVSQKNKLKNIYKSKKKLVKVAEKFFRIFFYLFQYYNYYFNLISRYF